MSELVRRMLTSIGILVLVFAQCFVVTFAAPASVSLPVAPLIPIGATISLSTLPIKEKYADSLLNHTALPFLQHCETEFPKLCQIYYDAVEALNASGSKSFLTPSDVQKIQFVSGDTFCTSLVSNLPKQQPKAIYNILANEERCTIFCKYVDPDNPYNMLVKDVCQYINAVYAEATPRNGDAIHNSEFVGPFSPKDNTFKSTTAGHGTIFKTNETHLANLSESNKLTDPAKVLKVQEGTRNTKLNGRIEPIKEIPANAKPSSVSTVNNEVSVPERVYQPPLIISPPEAAKKITSSSVTANTATAPFSPGNDKAISENAAAILPAIVAAESPPSNNAVQAPISPKDTDILPDDQMSPIGDENYGPVDQDPIKTHNEETADDDDDDVDGGDGGNNDHIAEPDQHPGDSVAKRPAVKHLNKDPFVVDEDSNFFSVFMFVLVLIVAAYVLYHNRRFVLALILEGRRRGGSGGDSNGRRKHTAAYRKLDSNLEEAIASPKNGTTRSQPIIY